LNDIKISLAAARVNAGLTQEDVARHMHVGKQTVCNWEKGATEPKITQAEELATLYKIPYNMIIFMPSKSNKI
jgi:DNA-binding XRE family transcriptional regulator